MIEGKSEEWFDNAALVCCMNVGQRLASVRSGTFPA